MAPYFGHGLGGCRLQFRICPGLREVPIARGRNDKGPGFRQGLW